MSTWQLQEAKQRFSEVVRAAEAGEPQVITRHGRDVVIIIEYEDYQKLVEEPRDFKKFLESAPFPKDFDLPGREVESEREIELS